MSDQSLKPAADGPRLSKPPLRCRSRDGREVGNETGVANALHPLVTMVTAFGAILPVNRTHGCGNSPDGGGCFRLRRDWLRRYPFRGQTARVPARRKIGVAVNGGCTPPEPRWIGLVLKGGVCAKATSGKV
jgi:hypothetical protein